MVSNLKRTQKIFKLLFWGFIVFILSFFNRDENRKSFEGFQAFKGAPPKAYADTPPPPPPPGDGGWGQDGDQGGGNSSGADADGGGGGGGDDGGDC